MISEIIIKMRDFSYIFGTVCGVIYRDTSLKVFLDIDMNVSSVVLFIYLFFEKYKVQCNNTFLR